MPENFSRFITEGSPFFENERQAVLYMTLLREGTLGTEKLHQKTHIHRESIQRELKKMERNGTVVFQQSGRNKKAGAVSVSSLQEILEMRHEKFENILKPLFDAEAANSKNTKVQVLYDSHAFGLLQMKLVKTQPRGQQVHVISNQGKSWIKAMIESGKLSRFEKIRLEREVVLELLCFEETRGQVEENAREYFAGQPPQLKRKYRYVDTELSSPLQIQIWFNSIVISIFSVTPSVHIMIENPQVVSAMLAYSKILWRTGKA